MPTDLEFTGERFLPGVPGEIAHEHWHRYAFAWRYVAGKRVADIACGEGYGSALLARAAATVVGVDIAADAIAHARSHYAGLANVSFQQGSAAALPLPDASIDAIVSFETIEHLPREDQPRMLAEFARVLKADGMLVLSTPNPIEYSVARNYRNPFHHHEPERAELAALLGAVFPAHRWFRQRRYLGSAVWSETDGPHFEAWIGDVGQVERTQPPAAMYFIVVAARSPADLPPADIALSLFADRADAELARFDGQAGEIMQLRDKNATFEQYAARVRYLDEIVHHREAQLAEVTVEREALASQLAAAVGEREALSTALTAAQKEAAAESAVRGQLEGQIAAHERTIGYRQSVRWWLVLPWFRLKLLWQGRRGH